MLHFEGPVLNPSLKLDLIIEIGETETPGVDFFKVEIECIP